ncbi:MAG: response regulator [Flavobacteriaceae bacterium]|nr:response regulator [Flavobacteriaceae bacterium]
MNKATMWFVLAIFVCTSLAAQDFKEKISLTQLDSILKEANKQIDTYDASLVLSSLDFVIEQSANFPDNDANLLKAKAYNLVGCLNYEVNSFNDAVDNWIKAETYAKRAKDIGYKAIVANNLGLVYVEELGEIEKGLNQFEIAYRQASKLDVSLKKRVAVSIAQSYFLIDNYTEGYKYLTDCSDFIMESSFDSDKAILFKLYGIHQSYHGKYDLAEGNFKEAIKIGTALNDFKIIADSFKAMSLMYNKLGQSDLAYNMLNEHLRFREKEIQQKKEVFQEIANAKFSVNDYKRALEDIKSEVLLEEKKLQESRFLTIGLVCLLLLLIVLVGPFIYNYKTKNRLGKSLELKNEELKIAKEKAEQVAEIKTKFISTVSHELRTPLYGVIGLSSILLERSKSKKDNELLKLLKFSADHLLNLINDVLQITKMDSYEVSLHQTNFNIQNLVKNITQSMEYRMGKNMNKLHLEFDQSIPNMLIGDSVKLSQVLINLLSNANKFTDNGDVWLKLSAQQISDESCGILFQIEDNGIGIPYDKQEDIFENFSQVNVNNYEAGTGLGLSIVKKLLDLFETKVKLESVPGKGSRFSFVIEFDREFSKSMNSLDKDIFIGDNSDYTILIVEDNKVNQIVTKNVLKKERFNSEIANDGLEALEMVQEKEYDLILMDLNMPRMDGIEATKEIRKFNSHTPIIALTASETEETIEEVFNSGFNDFISKPYKDFEFFQRIKKNISFAMSEAS